MTCDLPRDAVTFASDEPRCPWCGAYAGAATVTLEVLGWAYQDRMISRVRRAPDGSTEGCQISADCPECKKPFAVALFERRDGMRCVRTVAVRTPTDIRMLRGER